MIILNALERVRGADPAITTRRNGDNIVILMEAGEQGHRRKLTQVVGVETLKAVRYPDVLLATILAGMLTKFNKQGDPSAKPDQSVPPSS